MLRASCVLVDSRDSGNGRAPPDPESKAPAPTVIGAGARCEVADFRAFNSPGRPAGQERFRAPAAVIRAAELAESTALRFERDGEHDAAMGARTAAMMILDMLLPGEVRRATN